MKAYIGPYPDDDSERLVVVEVHDYDTWSADHTIALIALPLIKQLKETTNGSPFVENEDVPEELRAPEGFNYESGEVDENFHDRWQWVLGEMIFALESIVDDESEDQYFIEDETEEFGFRLDKEGYDAHMKRRQNGLRLFGTYFSSLWD